MLYLQSFRYSIHKTIRDKCRAVQTAILFRNFLLQKGEGLIAFSMAPKGLTSITLTFYRGMANRFNLRTKEPKVATLFDYMAPGMVNLKMGAPGEAMLKKCAEAMKKAAVHRMVCTRDT